MPESFESRAGRRRGERPSRHTCIGRVGPGRPWCCGWSARPFRSVRAFRPVTWLRPVVEVGCHAREWVPALWGGPRLVRRRCEMCWEYKDCLCV